MLAEITGLPDQVFGVRATGEVTSEDIKHVLQPGLKRTADKFNEIRYLLVLDTDVKNFTAGAWVQDAMAGLQNFTKWKKIAVVTAEKGVEWFTDIFTVATPGSSKGFKPDELEAAKAWLLNND
ncbi:STAS/SEC14 domain-containing protein [Pedobacter sp. HDW13]|uniref:STAS/SEC14 domain-containing protein n=1 Tax=unclassified Pedobacter TaxID=2628915 RepID=UPI000F5A469C|nr:MULTISPECIES: STAS/SEC14 domain-containing protein [unclassified Pedobacter]QIL42053.1 STAS/SEC14 domain-containing protein [Pedobacter sp. HDW13]RQO76714.1 STAS/SEC14 domain-containing protein [Pedobacter sp. KBW01]